MDDRAEIYLRHGPPDMKAGVGEDECGYWYYRREGLPEGDSFAVNFRRTVQGNDCIYARGPTTDMGRGHFAPGGMDPWDGPRIMEEVATNLAVARASDSYPLEPEEWIPLAVDPVHFAAEDGMTELVVYFGIPVDALRIAAERARYRKGLVVYDGEWREVTRSLEEMQYVIRPVIPDDSSGAAYLIDLFRLRIRPGEYHLALQVEDRSGAGIGVWKKSVTVPDFRAAGIELSELVLAGRVEQEGLDRFNRFGHVVLSLPSRVVVRGQPFFLYYEIYGLQQGSDGLARFRVEYAVRAERLDRGAVRRLFQGLVGLVGVRQERDAVVLTFDRMTRLGNGRRPEALSFETAGLPPGSYRST